MARNRTINAPGTELREIDRSGYNDTTDNSLVDTVAFVCGFADKGENYSINPINSIDKFQYYYGVPQNEAEKYLYNAASEVINRGGNLLVAKLPYDNESKDNYSYVDYIVGSDPITSVDFDLPDSPQSYNELNKNIQDAWIEFAKKIDGEVIQNEEQPIDDIISQINEFIGIEEYSADDWPTIIDDNNEFLRLFESYIMSKETGLKFKECKSMIDYVDYSLNDAISKLNELQIRSNTLMGKNKVVNQILEDISSIDSTLTSVIQIKESTNDYNSKNIKLMSMEELDKCLTRHNFNSIIKRNNFRIVDISRSQYKPIYVTAKENDRTIVKEVECLGIMPVVTTAVNAMFFQNVISSSYENDSVTTTKNINIYNPISDFRTFAENINNDIRLCDIDEENYQMFLSSNNIDDITVSKNASLQFPAIQRLREKYLDRQYLKSVGIVVFSVYADSGNDSKINFAPIESFVGSFDRNDRDENTGASTFIDNIVNTNSNYINLFSNVNITEKFKKASTFFINNQTATILGFTADQCVKNITYLNSIFNPLTRIFDKAIDPNQVPIDILIDGGVSNIAAYIGTLEEKNKNSNDINTYDPSYIDFSMDDNVFLERGIHYWKMIIQKYDNFAKITRKDLLNVVDGLRQFALNGNEKRIRYTDLNTTVAKTIIPDLPKLFCLNSSYSCGYCNWYLINDVYSGDPLWIPPSIKAAGVMINCDTYYYTWSAPAGNARATLTDVIDCSFSPNIDESGKIYNQAWNYAVNYSLNGVVVEGQKTFQLKPTALDRINVRRLCLYLEKNTVQISRRFLYEGNTSYNRQRLVDELTELYEDCEDENGISEFYIKCDDDNNTTETIERNELHLAIAIKPIKTIEFIVLNFLVTNQSANVEEQANKL